MMARILQLIHEIASKGIHVTKRDLFYTDVKLFQVRPGGRNDRKHGERERVCLGVEGARAAPA